MYVLVRILDSSFVVLLDSNGNNVRKVGVSNSGSSSYCGLRLFCCCSSSRSSSCSSSSISSS